MRDVRWRLRWVDVKRWWLLWKLFGDIFSRGKGGGNDPISLKLWSWIWWWLPFLLKPINLLPPNPKKFWSSSQRKTWSMNSLTISFSQFVECILIHLKVTGCLKNTGKIMLVIPSLAQGITDSSIFCWRLQHPLQSAWGKCSNVSQKKHHEQ